MEHPDRIRVVHRPRDAAKRARIIERTKQLIGTPFIQLPGNPPDHQVLFISTCGRKIRVKHVEQVYNDMLLCDAISDYGRDGPLYKDTIEGLQLEIYNHAVEAYKKRALN